MCDMQVLEYIGVAAFAVSGAMAAIDKKADIFGVLFLAVITALGGGIIRDILLGWLPPRMFTSYVYIVLALVCAGLVFLDAYARREGYQHHKDKLDNIVNIFDAVGLAVFTVTGMELAIEQYGMGKLVLAVMMGVTTGVGGGMLRDVLTNCMPAVLRKRIYAVASMAGALLYYALLSLNVNRAIGAAVAMLLIFSLRILATVYKWNLPKA